MGNLYFDLSVEEAHVDVLCATTHVYVLNLTKLQLMGIQIKV